MVETTPGELRQPQIMHCGCPSAQDGMSATFKFEGSCRNAQATIHEMECSSSRACGDLCIATVPQ